MNSKTFLSMYDGDGNGSMTSLMRGYGFREVRDLDDADIIVFNGGADIGTSIYKESPLYGGIPARPSNRDDTEIKVFKMFPNKFKLGICRGAQLLNCLNGGTLWQDVDCHGRDHMITIVKTGERIKATSTHHQMMRPYPSGTVIAVADEAKNKDAEKDHWNYRGGVFFADDHKDTEIVWYPDTQSLCIQGHPEYVPGSAFADYCLGLIKNCMKEVQSVAA